MYLDTLLHPNFRWTSRKRKEEGHTRLLVRYRAYAQSGQYAQDIKRAIVMSLQILGYYRYRYFHQPALPFGAGLYHLTYRAGIVAPALSRLRCVGGRRKGHEGAKALKRWRKESL